MSYVRSMLMATCALFLIACGDDGPDIKGDTNSPEFAAITFFHAMYNDQDLAKVMEMSTPKLARIIQSYGSTKQFARNVINMQFDSVNLEVDQTSRSVRKIYGDNATITLIFSGQLNGNKVDDMRSIKLIKVKSTWFVEKIIDDTYGR